MNNLAKKVFSTTLCLAFCVSLLPINAITKAQDIDDSTCTVTVIPSNIVNSISPYIYGSNMRVDGGGWDIDANQPYSSFESEYADSGLTTMRYPGGTIANLFQWQRAIGSLDSRSNYIRANDYCPGDSSFGVDEAAKFAEDHGSVMSYMYGMGNGSASDAADLVEYLNAPNDGTNPNGGTDWAAVRAANGHEEPYNIKDFEIGNEMYYNGQRYWLAGTSTTGKTSYEDMYVNGDTVSFEDQKVGTYDNWATATDATKGKVDASVALGEDNEVKYIKYFVDEGTETVKVDGTEWTKVESLDGSSAEDTVYTIDYSTGKLTFGDGTHGKQLTAGEVVTASYQSTHDGFKAYVSSMKAVDPSIRIYSCLETTSVIDLIGTDCNYNGIAMHPYTGLDKSAGSMDNAHLHFMLTQDSEAQEVADTLAYARSKFDGDEDRQAELNIFTSEWGIFQRQTINSVVYDQKNMSGTVFIAKSLMSWIDGGIDVATKHTTIDGDSGNTLFSKFDDQFVESGPAYAFKMFSKYFGDTRVLSTETNSPTVTYKSEGTLDYIETMASTNDNNDVYVMIVNADLSNDIPVKLKFTNCTVDETQDAEIETLSSTGNYLEYNTQDDPDIISISSSTMTASDSMTVTVPACSVMSVKVHATSISDPTAVDKTTLQATIESATEKVQSDYTKTSWNDFTKALETANSINEKEDANQVEVNEAELALSDAITNLLARITDDGSSSLVGKYLTGSSSEDNVLTDYTSYEKDGSKTSTALWSTEGKFGDSLEFTGNNDCYATVPVNFDTSGDFTVTTWVNMSEYHGTNGEVILQQKDNGTIKGRTWFYVSASNEFATIISGQTMKSGTSVETNKWYQLALVHSAGTVKLYVDGNLVATQQNNLYVNTSDLFVGRHKTQDTANEEWNGKIDELKFYNSALDPDQFYLGDKTDLTASISEADEKNEEDYTSTSWSSFKTVLLAATAVANQEDASQVQVDNSYYDLVEATEQLELIDDDSSIDGGSGETGSGETGSGETGSGETGSGETGSGETGSGETGSGETGSDDTDTADTGSDETTTDENTAPTIIEGDNQTVVIGNAVKIRSSAELKDFLKVLVDGNEVSSDNYTLEEGSTIVIFNEGYIESLDSGIHTVSIVSTTGTASTTMQIVQSSDKTSNPETSDNNSMLLVAIILSLAGVSYVLCRKRIKLMK